MTKTKAEKYNQRLHAIFEPELKRLKKLEAIAKEVLLSLNKQGVIATQDLENCYLINAITKVIGKLKIK